MLVVWDFVTESALLKHLVWFKFSGGLLVLLSALNLWGGKWRQIKKNPLNSWKFLWTEVFLYTLNCVVSEWVICTYRPVHYSLFVCLPFLRYFFWYFRATSLHRGSFESLFVSITQHFLVHCERFVMLLDADSKNTSINVVRKLLQLYFQF